LFALGHSDTSFSAAIFREQHLRFPSPFGRLIHRKPLTLPLYTYER
jgi:hypothetical protein